MTLNNFFHSCKTKSSHLFREFIWILTEKFEASEVKLISGEHQLTDVEQLSLNEWIQRRELDYPIQYFIGSTQFMGEKFHVFDGVLIPRMETEEIATWVVEASKNKKVRNLIDIGSGSGCLGIGTAIHLPDLEELVLVEPFGDESLATNVKNLCSLKSFKTEVVSDTFENYKFNHKFDLILSNPPYIRHGDPDVAKGVYDHEPHEALFGGDDGWEKVIQWVDRCYEWLSDDGMLVFEISHDQRDVIEQKLAKYKTVVHKDSFERDRFIVIKKIDELGN